MKLAAALHERFATWALRARPPEPVPIVLQRRRVYVLPTRAGLAFAVTLLAMLLGAINYNLSLGHALVFLLVGLGIIAILHTYRNLVGLRIDTGRAEPVFAGDAARFTLLLSGTDEYRRIVVSIPGSAAATDVAPGATSAAILSLPALRRGWLALPRVTLETSFPLGLVRAWSYAAPAVSCLVYPQPAQAAPPLPISGGGTGSAHSGGRGNEDFAGLRHHQPADPPRHIAWKTAARQDATAPLLTKQFAGVAAAIFWADWDELPPDMDAETRLSILARWVLDAAAAGYSWGLRLPSAVLTPGSGEAHLHASLKALALHDAR